MIEFELVTILELSRVTIMYTISDNIDVMYLIYR